MLWCGVRCSFSFHIIIRANPLEFSRTTTDSLLNSDSDSDSDSTVVFEPIGVYTVQRQFWDPGRNLNFCVDQNGKFEMCTHSFRSKSFQKIPNSNKIVFLGVLSTDLPAKKFLKQTK